MQGSTFHIQLLYFPELKQEPTKLAMSFLSAHVYNYV